MYDDFLKHNVSNKWQKSGHIRRGGSTVVSVWKKRIEELYKVFIVNRFTRHDGIAVLWRWIPPLYDVTLKIIGQAWDIIWQNDVI